MTHRYIVEFPRGCMECDITADGMREKLWEASCLPLSQVTERFAKIKHNTIPVTDVLKCYFSQRLTCSRFILNELTLGDFPGSPVVKTLPSNARGVDLICGHRVRILHALMAKKKKKKKNKLQKQYCNKFNKDFKNGPHQKKSFLKMNQLLELLNCNFLLSIDISNRHKEKLWGF